MDRAHPLAALEIIHVPHLFYADYTEGEFCRVSERIRQGFPTHVELDDTVYPDMETPWSVEISVLSDAYESDKQTVELKAGQLAVWFAGYVWIFNMNNGKQMVTQYAATISDVNSGELL